AERQRTLRARPGKALAFKRLGRSEFAERADGSGLALRRRRHEAAADFGPPTGPDHHKGVIRPAILAGFRQPETPARPRRRPAPWTVTSTSTWTTWSGRSVGIKPAG